MGCCGLVSRRKHGKLLRPLVMESPLDEVDTQSPAPSTPAHVTRRHSLTSIASDNTVYYDAPEEFEASLAGHVYGTSDTEHSSQAGGHETRPDENKGTISAIVDAIARRASLKSKSSLERRPSEKGRVESGTRASSGCLPSLSSQRDSGPVGAPSFRPFAGASFKRGEQVGSTEGVECWQVADATTFQIRGKDYGTTRKKINSRGAVYRLVGVDAYSFQQKIYHIAQHIQLPEPPKLGPDLSQLPADKQLPPLLVMNIQLPTHKPGLLSRAVDGKGVSLVYYFALPEGFELSHVENKAAVELLQRFVHDDVEQNGERTRDRLKLIARVVNVEQWAKEGPLTSYEHSLLRNYNDKPILTRPQHAFFRGPHYLEIDLDIHSYAWMARQAFDRFIPRLGPVVFENAFVVQGNQPEELPEVIMACARVSRIDLYKVQPFPASLRKTISHRTTVELDPDAPPLVSTTFPDDDDDDDDDVSRRAPGSPSMVVNGRTPHRAPEGKQ